MPVAEPEPTQAPTADPPASLPRLLIALLPATTAMYALYQGVQLVLLPAAVQRLDPGSKVGSLALLTALAAIAGLVALPLGGSVSDRTRSRFGRRTPWLVISSLLSAALLGGLASATALSVLAVCYTLLWFTSNFYQGALVAILPDRVPAGRRGAASAVIGMGTPLGVLFGVNLASRLQPLWAHLTIALVLVTATLVLVFAARERPVATTDDAVATADDPGGNTDDPVGNTDGPRGSARAYLRAFGSRDFTLAFVSRAGLFLAYFTVTGYLFYILTDHIGAANLPGGNVPAAVGLLATVSVLASLAATVLAGWLADRLNRRKLLSAVSSVGLGLSMLVPMLIPGWTAMIAFAGLSGLFLGAYLAVDLAVMSLVLPHAHHTGRDFGILAVATGFPQILSGPLSGLLISTSGYPALFAFGAVASILSGGAVLGIRAVR